MTKLEQIARALAVHQFGSDESWKDQIPMARTVVEALREPNKRMLLHGNSVTTDGRGAEESWPEMVDAILSEKPECTS